MRLKQIKSNIKNKLNNQKILDEIEKLNIKLKEVREQKKSSLTETEYRYLEVEEARLLHKIEELKRDVDFNNICLKDDDILEKRQRKKISEEEYVRLHYGIKYQVIELSIRRNESDVAYNQKVLDYRNWMGYKDGFATTVVQKDLKKAQEELKENKALLAQMKKIKDRLDNTIYVTAEAIEITEEETRISIINKQTESIRQAIGVKKEKIKGREKE